METRPRSASALYLPPTPSTLLRWRLRPRDVLPAFVQPDFSRGGASRSTGWVSVGSSSKSSSSSSASGRGTRRRHAFQHSTRTKPATPTPPAAQCTGVMAPTADVIACHTLPMIWAPSPIRPSTANPIVPAISGMPRNKHSGMAHKKAPIRVPMHHTTTECIHSGMCGHRIIRPMTVKPIHPGTKYAMIFGLKTMMQIARVYSPDHSPILSELA